MAILVGATTASTTGPSPRSATQPSSIAAGDLIILHVGLSDDVAPTVPSGFNLIAGAEITGADNIRIYVKVATASEPANYSVSYPSGNGRIQVTRVYSDAALELLVNAIAAQTNGSGDRLWPSITTTALNTLLACFATYPANTGTTEHAGMTEIYDGGSGPHIYLMAQAIAAAGATGTRTGTGTATTSKCIALAWAEAPPLDPLEDMAAVAVSETEIYLSWTDPNDPGDIDGYSIERSADGVSGWAEIDTTTDLFYLDSGLSAATEYWYRVRVFVVVGMTTVYSDYSDTVSATTQGTAPTPGEYHPPSGVMRFFMLAPTVVFAARVNQASFSYPLAEVTYDTVTVGSFGDISPGQTVVFGTAAGATDLGRQRIRKAADASKIYFGRSSEGVNDGEVDLADNIYITVWDLRMVWSKIPVINNAGAILKDHDLAVGDNTVDPPPVANTGPAFAGEIDPATGAIVVAFDGANSVAIADAATITAYQWDFGDGTVLLGAEDEVEATVSFPPGFRYVSLTVTDSNAKTHTAYAPILAIDPDNDPCISVALPQSLKSAPQGQTLTVNVRSPIPTATYPNGTLVLLIDGNPANSADRTNVLFTGWHQRDPASIVATREATLMDVTLECLDVAMRLDVLPGFAQTVEANDTPATWLEMAAPNLDKYIHYLLFWHSSALELADYTPSGVGASYPFMLLGSDGESLYDQTARIARAFGRDHLLTCNRVGQLAVRVDPMLQDEGDRTAVVQAALTAADYTDLRYTHQRPPNIHWLRGSAILADNDAIEAIFSIAPGLAPGQGEVEQTHSEELTTSQAELNSLTGHRYARINARQTEFDLTLHGGSLRGLDPAALTWLQLTLAAEFAAQRGLSFTEARGLIKSMELTFDHTRAATLRTVRLKWERETVGIPAVTEVRATAPNPPNPTPYPLPGDTAPTPGSPGDGLDSGQNNVVVIDNLGTENFIFRTFDFQTASGDGGPTWEEVALETGEEIHYSWVVDPFSPGYVGGGTAIAGWVAGESAIFRLDDLFGATAATAQHTFAEVADPASFHWRTIGASFGRFFSGAANPWLICASYYKDTAGKEGVWVNYSLDAGATWSDDVLVAAGYNSGTEDQFSPIALWLSPRTPGFALCAAYSVTGDPPTGAIYATFDWGATWTPYGAPDPPSDPDEPVPYWALVGDSGNIESTSWGQIGTATVRVTRTGSGTSTGGITLILVAPPNCKRVAISGHWAATRTSDDPVHTSESGDIDEHHPTSHLTVTTDFAYSGPGSNSSTNQDFTLTWEAAAGWKPGTTDIDDAIDNQPIATGDYPNFELSAAVSVSGSHTAEIELTLTLTITEIELENSHTYVPPVQPAGVLDPINRLAGGFHVPYADNAAETVIYHGAADMATDRLFRLKLLAGGVATDVSPTGGGVLYGSQQASFGIRAFDNDRSYLVAAVIGNDTSGDKDDDLHAVYVSDDAGATWTEIVAAIPNSGAPAGRPAFAAAFGGSDSDVIFVWGPPDYMAYSDDFGASVDDRSGNLASFGAEGLIGIAGGPL